MLPTTIIRESLQKCLHSTDFLGNSNKPALLKLKLHVIFILLTTLKEALHSFHNFVA